LSSPAERVPAPQSTPSIFRTLERETYQQIRTVFGQGIGARQLAIDHVLKLGRGVGQAVSGQQSADVD
jgi:hypothetical protein